MLGSKKNVYESEMKPLDVLSFFFFFYTEEHIVSSTTIPKLG